MLDVLLIQKVHLNKKIYIYAFYSGTLAHPTAGPDAAVTTQNSKRILAFKKIDSEEKKKINFKAPQLVKTPQR